MSLDLNARAEALFAQLQSNPEKFKSEVLSETKKMEFSSLVSIKKEENMKLLVLKEIRLPFNPITGMSDDMFNDGAYFRMDELPTETLRTVYSFAQRGESVERLKQQIGYDFKEEELEPGMASKELINALETLRDDEKETSSLLGSMVASDPAVEIKNELFTNRVYATKYTVDYDPAALSKMTAEEREKNTPFFRKLKMFEDALTRREIELLEETEEYKNKSKDDQKEARKAIWQRTMMGRLSPINYYIVLEIPLDKEGNLEVDLSTESISDLTSRIKLMKKYQDLTVAIDKMAPGKAKAKFNKYLDFYNIDVFGGTTKTSDKNLQYKEVLDSTTYEQSDSLAINDAKESEIIEKITEAFRKFLGGKKIDEVLKELMPSRYTLKGGVNDKALAKAFSLVKPYEKIRPFLTEEAIIPMRALLKDIYPDNYQNLMDGSYKSSEAIAVDTTQQLLKDEKSLNDKEANYTEDSQSATSIEDVESFEEL